MRDIIYVISVLFFVSISAVFGYIVLSQMAQQPIFQSEILVNESFTSAQSSIDTTLDQGFIILFFSMVAGAMVLGHLIPTRPIFFVPFIIILIFLVIMVVIVSNIWYEFTQHPTINPYMSNFTYIPHVMNNLPFYTVGIAIILSIIVYSSVPKERRG